MRTTAWSSAMRSRIIGAAPPARRSCRRRVSSVHRRALRRARQLLEQREADVALLAPPLALLRGEPDSVVDDLEEEASAVRRGARRRRRPPGRAARRCAAPRRPRGRRAARPPRSGRGRVDRELGLEAAGPQRREEVVERGLEPARAQVRRVDLDEQRAEPPHGVTRPRGGGSASRASGEASVSAAALSEYEIPARSWTGPSWRSAAIRRRSSADASTARRSNASRSSCVRWSSAEAPGERHLDEPEQDEAARGAAPRTGARSSGRWRRRRFAAGRSRRAGRPVRRADREVDLVEVAQATLEPVLRPGEVAQLRASCPVRSTRASRRRAGTVDPMRRGSSE